MGAFHFGDDCVTERRQERVLNATLMGRQHYARVIAVAQQSLSGLSKDQSATICVAR